MPKTNYHLRAMKPISHKRKANPKNMKKTTAKGAYKKSAKKQMVKRRAPMVETKKVTQEDIATGNEADQVPDGVGQHVIPQNVF